jgi:RNA-directed DNA polymerase
VVETRLGNQEGAPPLLPNFGPADGGSTLRKLAASTPSDWYVILHANLDELLHVQTVAEEWLAKVGLELHPDKTRITHTLDPYNGQMGFDFLGFHIRQFHVGKYRTYTFRGKPGFKTIIKPSPKAVRRHCDRLRDIIHRHRGAPQAALIRALNPVIHGWANYYQYCVAKRVFHTLDGIVYQQLRSWARYRHSSKGAKWRYQRYWRRIKGWIRFSDGEYILGFHQTTWVKRFVKVRNVKSPYDGDWVYWSTRLGRDPSKPRRVTRLLKRQRGRCTHCGSCFTAEDVIEVHHHDGNHRSNAFGNLRLLHGHCHDIVHGTRCQ